MCVGNLSIGRIQEGKNKINNENKFNFCKTAQLSTTIIYFFNNTLSNNI